MSPRVPASKSPRILMDSIPSSLPVPIVPQLVNLPSKPPMKWEQLAQNVPSKSTVSEQFIFYNLVRWYFSWFRLSNHVSVEFLVMCSKLFVLFTLKRKYVNLMIHFETNREVQSDRHMNSAI